MAQFATVGMPTFNDVIVDDQSATQPGTERVKRETLSMLCLASPVFTVGRGIGIILQDGGQTQCFGDLVTNRELIPTGQVCGFQQHSCRNIHGAGTGQSGSGDLREIDPGLQQGQLGGPDHLLHPVHRANLSFRWHAGKPQRQSGIADDAGFDVCAPQIDAQIQSGLLLLVHDSL